MNPRSRSRAPSSGPASAPTADPSRAEYLRASWCSDHCWARLPGGAGRFGGQPAPGGAVETAKDSVGGGLAVAERAAQDPAAGPQQAQAAVDAVHQAFARGVAQTSLIGGIIMAAGTPIVLAVLPGRRGFARKSAEPGAGTTASEATTVREHTGSTRWTPAGRPLDRQGRVRRIAGHRPTARSPARRVRQEPGGASTRGARPWSTATRILCRNTSPSLAFGPPQGSPPGRPGGQGP